MKKIIDIAKDLNIGEDNVSLYGNYKAKIEVNSLTENKNGKLVLVTATNPTPAGEGKTTTTIGLSMALNKIGINSMVALREPSLGPCMGMKGGAVGGGKSIVIPTNDINLHFTGDIHAVTSANNLLSALIDNHIFHGNELNIKNVVFKRVMDMNDRQLKNIQTGFKLKKDVVREDNFMISAASEVMAILCLCTDIKDLKRRLSNIIIGYDINDNPVYAKDINAQGPMTALLKDAIKPNLVQTLEETPALIHGGPFANIAHGCNSIIATKIALKLSDVVITEAGFGSDLGAEKFLDIKCSKGNLAPDCIVIVSTIRSLKYNAHIDLKDIANENLEACENGFSNLKRHILNMKMYNVPVVVCLNRFNTDTDAEINLITDKVNELGVDIKTSTVFMDGSAGGVELAKIVLSKIENKTNNFKPLYDKSNTIIEKIDIVAKNIYKANNIIYSDKALLELEKINKLNLNHYEVCISKTPYSFTDNKDILGAPTDFDITVTDIKIANGSEFIVVYLGNVITMPGLLKEPAANFIDVDDDLNITGIL